MKVTDSSTNNHFEFTTCEHQSKVAPNAISQGESRIYGNYEEFRTQQFFTFWSSLPRARRFSRRRYMHAASVVVAVLRWSCVRTPGSTTPAPSRCPGDLGFHYRGPLHTPGRRHASAISSPSRFSDSFDRYFSTLLQSLFTLTSTGSITIVIRAIQTTYNFQQMSYCS